VNLKEAQNTSGSSLKDSGWLEEEDGTKSFNAAMALTRGGG
jgi:hypothetical protein